MNASSFHESLSGVKEESVGTSFLGTKGRKIKGIRNAMSLGKKVAISFQSYDLTRIANVRVPDMFLAEVAFPASTTHPSCLNLGRLYRHAGNGGKEKCMDIQSLAKRASKCSQSKTRAVGKTAKERIWALRRNSLLLAEGRERSPVEQSPLESSLPKAFLTKPSRSKALRDPV
ncbi:hypothetical protein M9H77_28207 [Catharanthus roseus]|uniref:Uncharacterized protein n=1 Tax=Catharanthus roseus TaxID=4058 RepID=A0ACC0AGY0_CATRO|nr:hypothetical protein M9H77_28207 [Catharanthus roseus]